MSLFTTRGAKYNMTDMLELSPPVCLAPTGDWCGEGAVWHAADNSLYWTDINRFLIHRYDTGNHSVKTWFFNQPVTGMILTDRDEVLTAVLGSGVILWSPVTDERFDQ